MSFLKSWGVKSIALALAVSLAPLGVPSGTPLVGVTAAKADPRWDRRGWDGHRGYHDGGRRYYSHRRHNGIGSGGAALAGAVIGLGIGAAIASQPRYYEPAPRYYRAAPRYYTPAPTYYRVAPRYHAAPRYVSARPAPWSREWYNYCSARYRSFDARSGTFQPYNGPRQFCQ
ncbi:BA14K family protein [Aurantimonas sp. Leaf443]|uniref:BA14K family protein n=1 Tax=Aurantimonas sp. Leaf443 TaxID=1736378 RepID=UPI0009EC2A0C|nr:BA14K family protein [Aurantimonas sp. Leaf443]